MTSEHSPSSTDRFLNQALQCYEKGNLDKAAELVNQILQQEPSRTAAWRLAALIAAGQGDINKALQNIDQALSLDQNDPILHFDQGLILKQSGDLDRAMASYRQAVTLQPAFPEAQFNLGNLYKEQNRLDEAIACYRLSIESRPGYSRALFNLADCLQQRGDRKQAVSLYQQLLALNPDQPNVYHNLGSIAQAGGDIHGAIRHYLKALELDPNKPPTLAILADLYEKQHRLEEARQYAQRALELDPAYPTANRVIATVLRCDGQADKAYEQLSPVNIPDNQPLVAQDLHFELGKICDRTGRYEEAFAHFSAGKRALAQAQHASTADKDSFYAMVSQLKDCFTRDRVSQWQTLPANQDAEPVFLIGFPRSGTTLLDQILDSHPAIEVIEERPVLSKLRDRIEGLPGGYPAALANLDNDAVTQLSILYYSELARYVDPEQEGRLYIDKLPLNILHVGLCSRVFPAARYILALRHPCDACLSCFMQPFTHNRAMASFYTIEDSVTMYRETMSLWLQYRDILDLDVHTVRYEDVVADFSGEARKILEFLQLPWDDRIHDYNKHARSRGQIRTPSYNQVRQDIYTSSLQRWKHYRSYLQPHLDSLEPFITAFGYQEAAD